MKIPILTYDSMRIHGAGYEVNDLAALSSDVRQVTEAGFQVVPLRTLVDAWLADRTGELSGRLVALACDHGADFDFLDLPHPTAGVQRSVLNTLHDFAAEHPGAQDRLHVTSFVVASPDARAVLDATCMVGRGWWTDSWWTRAVASGLMHIGNGSWDHHHESLPEPYAHGTVGGNFWSIDSSALADYEIRRAAEYLEAKAPNPGTALFAYPYGQANAYLVREYFPRHGAELGLRAAFTARPAFFEPDVGRWEIPRFVCGRDWKSPAGLRAILDASTRPDHAWVPVHGSDAGAEPRVRRVVVGDADVRELAWNAASITDPGFRSRFLDVPHILSDWLGPLEGLEVLDFGCGEGVTALGVALEHGVRRVTGVDIMPDPGSCPVLAREQLGLERLPASLELYRVTPGVLHREDDRFDAVYSWSVFEHVDERLVARMLRALHACLEPGGKLLVQIAPLYYSADGAHLYERLPEPWVHLTTQHDVLHSKVAAAARDRGDLERLWGTYRTLNRITAGELLRHVEDAGFEIVRTHTTCDPRPIPARLRAIFHEDVLRTDQVVILGRAA